ncbi:MAG: hypothetical protein SOW44_04925 [Porphyromonas sp.]|nr:hypothetical protein [Bacteroidales bacterium]MDY3100667.1 hypothetical protein [Porphyromonas sp.]
MDFCIIGRDIGYTLSPALYAELWAETGEEGHTFVIEDIPRLAPFIEKVRRDRKLSGFTVTSPYKEEIVPYLDRLTPDAEAMRAVNTVRVSEDGLLIGHNTDIHGFMHTLPRLSPLGEWALVCGNGGAAKAVREGLKRLGIPFDLISRHAAPLTYDGVKSLAGYTHIINATPAGSVKVPDEVLPLPYDTAKAGTVFYDLNYAPPLTPFLMEGLKHGGIAVNGLPMLRAIIFSAQWPFLSNSRAV